MIKNCPVTNKKLDWDYQTLGWEGSDMIKIEFTKELATYCIENIDTSKNGSMLSLSQCYSVLKSENKVFILEPFYDDILSNILVIKKN